MRYGNTGSEGHASQNAKIQRTKAPTRNGRSVLHEAHGYMTPAQLSGSENKVLPTANNIIPIQSSRRILTLNAWSIGRRRMKKMVSKTAMPQKGRFTQPIHLQFTIR